MPRKKDDYPIHITHVMADGTERDSIEGVVVPLNEKTKLFYDTISKLSFKPANDKLG